MLKLNNENNIIIRTYNTYTHNQQKETVGNTLQTMQLNIKTYTQHSNTTTPPKTKIQWTNFTFNKKWQMQELQTKKDTQQQKKTTPQKKNKKNTVTSNQILVNCESTGV